MPERETADALDCGAGDVEAGRAPTQLGWYEFASKYVKNKTVLDVGCGLGHGLDILQNTAEKVQGQDLDDRLEHPDIQIGPVEEIADKSFDIVTSFDVIEHVSDPEDFTRNLFRVAREAVFITTPNWTASRCAWPYHLREYTPRELTDVLQPYGSPNLFKGTPDGSRIHQVSFPQTYNLLNDLMTWKSTDFWMKYCHKLLPRSCKIGSTLGALVVLPKSES